MSENLDAAQEDEQTAQKDKFDLALEEQARKSQAAAAVSAYECEECGEPIPEARRRAVIGCRCCVDCQNRLDQLARLYRK